MLAPDLIRLEIQGRGLCILQKEEGNLSKIVTLQYDFPPYFNIQNSNELIFCHLTQTNFNNLSISKGLSNFSYYTMIKLKRKSWCVGSGVGHFFSQLKNILNMMAEFH